MLCFFDLNGFIDRMFNPRPALRAYAAMSHLLGQAAEVTVDPALNEALRTARFRVGAAAHVLVSGIDQVQAAALAKKAGAQGLLDLCAGQTLTQAAGPAATKPGLWVLTNVAH